jgi:hypothetical protein
MHPLEVMRQGLEVFGNSNVQVQTEAMKRDQLADGKVVDLHVGQDSVDVGVSCKCRQESLGNAVGARGVVIHYGGPCG